MSEVKKTTAQKQMDRAEAKAREKLCAALGEWLPVREAQLVLSNIEPDDNALSLARSLAEKL